MQTLNQPEYYASREQQQRTLASRSMSPETRSFHEDLANHYARLICEVTGVDTRERQRSYGRG
ncbi:MAG TPA: hypothetical protein VF695_11965 [Sphingomonas sp.]